jgi:hypothetical protein
MTESSRPERYVGDDNKITPGSLTKPQIDATTSLARDPETEKINKINQEELAKELGVLFSSIVQAAIGLTSLRNQKTAAERDLNTKETDYNKSRTMHGRFPATEESQRRQRTVAQERVAALDEKIKLEDTVVREATLQSATKLALTQNGSQDNAMSQNRVDELEKKYIASQDQVNELEATCQQFQVRFQEQKAFMDSIRNEQKKAREEVDKKLEQEKQQQANDSWENKVTLKSVSDDIRAVKNLAAGLPIDLRARLDKIYDIEKTIKGISISQKQSVTSTTFEGVRKELLSIKESIGNTDERLATVEEKQKNVTQFLNNLSLDPMKTRLDNIENSQKADTFKTASFQTEVISIGKQIEILPEVKRSMVDIQKDLALFRELDVEGKFLLIANKLAALEKLPHSATSLSVSSSDSLNSTLSIRNDISKAVSAETDTIRTQLIELILSSQEAADNGVATLIDDIRNRCTAIEKDLLDLKMSHGTPVESSQKLQSQQQAIETLRTDLDHAKTSLVDVSIHKTIEAIQNQPTVLPLAQMQDHVMGTVKSSVGQIINQALSGTIVNAVDTAINEKLNNLATSFGDINKTLSDRIDAVNEAAELGLANIDNRFQNINTKDFALHVIGQLEATYPLVRDAQTTLQNHITQLDTLSNQIVLLEKHQNTANNGVVNVLQESVNILAKKLMQAEDALLDSIKDLAKRLAVVEVTATEVANVATKAVASVTKAKSDQEEQYQVDVAGQIIELQNHNVTLDVKIANYQLDQEIVSEMQGDIRRLDSQVQKLQSSSISNAAMPAPRAPSRVSAALSPRSVSMSNGNARAFSVNQRGTSFQTDGSNKKRRLNGSRSSSSTVRGINGINGTKKRKNVPRLLKDGDNSDDEDFEPSQPQITISDDDDD